MFEVTGITVTNNTEQRDPERVSTKSNPPICDGPSRPLYSTVLKRKASDDISSLGTSLQTNDGKRALHSGDSITVEGRKHGM